MYFVHKKLWKSFTSMKEYLSERWYKKYRTNVALEFRISRLKTISFGTWFNWYVQNFQFIKLWKQFQVWKWNKEFPVLLDRLSEYAYYSKEKKHLNSLADQQLKLTIQTHVVLAWWRVV